MSSPAGAVQAPLLGVQQISAGGSHTCALVNGAAQCWGDNSFGQLGNGTYLLSSTATPVRGLTSGVTAIASGSRHNCVLVNGGVRCWGYNYDGELGNGSTTNSNVSVTVSGISGATTLDAGSFHTCAIINGAVKCWGYNYYGQLGNGVISTSEPTPVAVSGITAGATAVSGGLFHSCAVVNGGAQCWGDNNAGELGNGTNTNSTVPVSVIGLGSGVSAISAGADLTCAIVNGGAQCWGDSGFGALGNGSSFTSSSTPVTVTGLSTGVVAIAAGNGHACAAVNYDATHPVKCWGHNNNGQLGNGSVTDSTTPVDVIFFPALASAETVTALAIGVGFNTCARIVNSSTGRMRMDCWGQNYYGELGVAGPLVQSPVAVAVVSLGTGVTAIGMGGAYARHACALVGGAAKCWGQNSDGELGNGIKVDSSSPQSVVNLGSGVTGIAIGADHSCAVQNGAALCWGADYAAQLGSPFDSTTPVPVTGLSSGVTAVAAGDEAGCAIVNGGAQCWGLGYFNSNPVPVSGLSTGVTSIAVGSTYNCAIVSGGVQCWNSGNSTPYPIQGLSANVTALAAGVKTTCAVVSGAARCWGDNTYGQLGNGVTGGNYATPVAVLGLASGVTAVASGGDNGEAHVCAVVNGAAMCWGSNMHGQLGNGTFNSSNVPVSVTGLSSGVAGITVGASHSCAQLASGAEQCWGDGHYGQLGDGRLLTAETPQAVVAGDEIFSDGFN